LEHDGYLYTASGETTGSGKVAAESNTASSETTAAESFSEALTRERLENVLMPVQVYGHKLWRILCPDFSEWIAQAPCAIDIMCALLSRTGAWTVFDQVALNLELEAVALVGPALLTLGVDPSFIKDVWQEKLLDKYIRLSEEETGKIRQPLQHMIGEAMKGSFAMSEEQVNKALSSAPGKKELKRHLHKYFGSVRRFRGISTAGSSAKPIDIDQTMDDLDACKEGSTAFGQELADIGTITDTVSVPRIVLHLDAMILKLTTLKQSNTTANQKVLKNLNDAAAKLLAKVDVKTEKTV